MKSKWIDKWRHWFTRENLIVVVLTGVLLLVIAWPAGTDEASESTGVVGTDAAASNMALASDAADTDGSADELDRYCTRQEERLEAVLAQVEGVGSVEVMLTVSASRELVVLKDTQSTTSETDETDAQGGTRTVAQREAEETTVTYDAEDGSAPYVIGTLEPRVEGVLVIAEGADSGTVRSEVVRIIQALYDVGANHVQCVAKSK